MEQRDKILEEYYAQMGIAKPVYDFCMKVEEELKDRFLSIDKTAECNQMKVLRAMQKDHLSEACFAPTTGYGYNDIGRETLEKIYADVFATWINAWRASGFSYQRTASFSPPQRWSSARARASLMSFSGYVGTMPSTWNPTGLPCITVRM